MTEGQNPAEYSAALLAVKAKKMRSELQPGSKTLGKKKPQRSRTQGALLTNSAVICGGHSANGALTYERLRIYGCSPGPSALIVSSHKGLELLGTANEAGGSAFRSDTMKASGLLWESSFNLFPQPNYYGAIRRDMMHLIRVMET